MSKEHKGKVKRELIIHAFTHDLSKFSIAEFIPYAEFFHGYYGVVAEKTYTYEQINNGQSCVSNSYLECKKAFLKGWEHHKDKNKHHWNYWDERNLEMPTKYIRQMICDWMAMSVKFNSSPQEFYLKNYTNIKLNKNDRHFVEILLKVAYEGLDDQMNYSTIEEIIKNSLEYEKRNPNSFDYEWFYGEYLGSFKSKYNIDMLDILGFKDETLKGGDNK